MNDYESGDLEVGKSSRDEILPEYLQDAIILFIFYHSHAKRLLVLYSAATQNCLFQINGKRHMALQQYA